MHPNLKTRLVKHAVTKKKNLKIQFSVTSWGFCVHQVCIGWLQWTEAPLQCPHCPSVCEVWVSACQKLPCTWGVFRESCSSSRLPDASLLPGAEAGSPCSALAHQGEQHCGGQRETSPGRLCALCSSVLNDVGVTGSAQSITRAFQCLQNRSVYWQDCKLKLVVLWRNALLYARGLHLASHHLFCWHRCPFVSAVICWLGGRISVQ